MLTLGAVALSVGSSPRVTAQRRPHVILVTLDTTRADRMGFLGSSRGLTPSLDALARTSLVFTRAYAQAPVTTVSHATILTGTFPPFHRVNDFGSPLPSTVPDLPDLLHRQGYRTGAFVGSLILDPRNGTAPGFDRGFDTYDAGFELRRPGQDRYQTVERRWDVVLSRALDWMRGCGEQACFTWIHLYDPHDPYDPPAAVKRRFAAAPYDGEIAWVDQLIGRLITTLQERGWFDGSVLIVAGDHGEALGDHGENTHGLFLYDSTLRVPLLVRLPNGKRAGRVEARVRLADVAPTVLEAAGVSIPPDMQGSSMLGLVAGNAAASRADDRPVYAETEYPRRAFGWAPLAAWRADRFLYVRAPKRELYDEEADAAAARNLVATRERVAEGMDRELEQFIRKTSGAAGSNAGRHPDPDLAARLAALGYVSGGDSTAPTGIDPKDRVAIANALHDAVAAVEDGAFAEAVPLLEKVTASEPGVFLAQLQLGIARAHARQYARAVPPLRKAIALQPDQMLGHYELGVALFETGSLQEAVSQFELVASRMPKWADARYSLASVYARVDRVPDAIGELRAALDLSPRHFRANLLLGRLLALSGQAVAAVPLLRTAVDVDPTSAEAHEFLADACEAAGDHDGAAAERQLAHGLRLRKPR